MTPPPTKPPKPWWTWLRRSWPPGRPSRARSRPSARAIPKWPTASCAPTGAGTRRCASAASATRRTSTQWPGPPAISDCPARTTSAWCASLPTTPAPGENFYAHPVEGVAAFVNLTTGKIIDFIDIDRNAPVTRNNCGSRPRLQPAAAPAARAAPHHAAGGPRLPRGEQRGAVGQVALPLRHASARRAGALHRGLRRWRTSAAGAVPRVAGGNGGALRRPRRGVVLPQHASMPANWGWASLPARCVPAWIARRTARCTMPPWPPNPARRRRFPAPSRFTKWMRGVAWKHARQYAPRPRPGGQLPDRSRQLRVRLRVGFPPGRHARMPRPADRHHGGEGAWRTTPTILTATWWAATRPPCTTSTSSAFAWIWTWTASRTR